MPWALPDTGQETSFYRFPFVKEDLCDGEESAQEGPFGGGQ
jgi:hypothetical protein